MLTSIAVMTWRSLRTMVTRRFATAAAGIGACALVAAAAYAQTPESVNVDIAGCVDVETREQQIACYLARVDEAVEAHESGATAAGSRDPNDLSSAPRDAAQPQSRPQREASAAAAASRPPDEAEEEEEEEIVATITSIREVQPNIYVLNLDNGQVWRQSAPKRYFLREGAEVHLVPTPWGESYRLTDPDVGNFIQVERVR